MGTACTADRVKIPYYQLQTWVGCFLGIGKTYIFDKKGGTTDYTDYTDFPYFLKTVDMPTWAQPGQAGTKHVFFACPRFYVLKISHNLQIDDDKGTGNQEKNTCQGPFGINRGSFL